MIQTYKDIFVRDLLVLHKEVFSFKDEETLWKILPGTTNSAGNLSLHLLGNINHFIGAGLGKTGYVRKREQEFLDGPVTRGVLIQEVNSCIEMVKHAFLDKTDTDLEKDFPLPWREGEYFATHFMLSQLVLHFNYHLGQINYHRRFFDS